MNQSGEEEESKKKKKKKKKKHCLTLLALNLPNVFNSQAQKTAGAR